MKTILRFVNWLASFFRKPLHETIMDASEPLHPFVRAALEKERRRFILNRLRMFYRQRPRPWRGHQAFHRKLAR